MDLEKITNLEGRMDKDMEVYAENINRMEDGESKSTGTSEDAFVEGQPPDLVRSKMS